MKNFIDELKWRGMLQDIIPGTEDHLNNNKSLGYIGFDPTSPLNDVLGFQPNAKTIKRIINIYPFFINFLYR